jgi:uracil-DNA glycosylase family 4
LDLLEVLNQEIIVCTRCPRLVEYRAEVARVKRRAYRDCEYWGRPVPGFGDPHARLLLLGLAPGAHGSNRTGRMFTGDSSGDFLYRALFETGFASQPASISKDDGLTLRDAYISAAARCAPPDNKPTPQEIRNCGPYLERELELLKDLRVVLALGRVAFDVYLAILRKEGKISRRSDFVFGHNTEHRTGPGQPLLISSFHPSQQNTSTGKLTESMFRAVFLRAKRHLESR